MSVDAKFADGVDKPLRLHALDVDDLNIVSSLVQDSVFPASEMRWSQKNRQFSILLNRFRWEDADNAEKRKRSFERVQSVLTFSDVMQVRSQGVPRGDSDTILSLLSVMFDAGEDGTGGITLTLAGDGVIVLNVEALGAQLYDATRPYEAVSKQRPSHFS